MYNLKKYNPQRSWLLSMINAIDKEIGLKEEDKVLIVLQLSDENKISQFNEWIKTKIVNGKLKTTSSEVMNETAQIGRIKI